MAPIKLFVLNFVTFRKKDITEIAIRNQDVSSLSRYIEFVVTRIQVKPNGQERAVDNLLGNPIWLGIGSDSLGLLGFGTHQ